MNKQLIMSLMVVTLLVFPISAKNVELGIFTTYSGKVDKDGRAIGRGTITMKQKADAYAGSYIFKTAGLKDELSGMFSGNMVENATIKFASDWTYSGGSVIYTITTKEDTDVISYKLKGGELSSTDGSNIHLSPEESCIITRSMNSKETSVRLDSCFQEVGVTSSYKIGPIQISTLGNTKGAKLIIGYGILSKGVKTRVGSRLLSLNAEEKYEEWEVVKDDKGSLTLADGTNWTFTRDETDYLIIKDNKGNYFKWNQNTSKFGEIVRCFNDGIAKFVPNGDSSFLYANGDNYTGTCDFYSVNVTGSCSSPSQVIQKVLQTNSIYECNYMIRDGIFIFNGNNEVWKNSLTNYQAGRIAGNYDKAVNEYKRAQAMELEAKKNNWLKTKETLKEEFDSRYVDALFNYRLVLDMPLELFKRAKELGAPFNWQGPITIDNTYDVYVITMYNLETGEIQYQRVLRFSYIWHRLISIDTNF